MTLLALLSDAYGADGGIAKVNRDLLGTLASHRSIDRVRVFSRVPASGDPVLPVGVELNPAASDGAAAFVAAVGKAVVRGGYDGVICGHLHLAPLAALAAARAGVPWILIVHGVEVWGPPHWPATQGRLVQAATRRALVGVDRVVSVSALTRDRFSARFSVPTERITVVPNSVDLADYGPGPKRPDLLSRYGLRDQTVLMTLARLAPSERDKGVDEVIKTLPVLAREIPDIAYLVCGGGGDRQRLEALAAALGVADRVTFAGYVPEDEKADHYRLADAFVMPGRKEGFGIVYLEALACGIPAVASSADASREAVRDGMLGVVVDPADQASVVSGIRDALGREKGVPDGLAYFSHERFVERWNAVVDELFVRSPAAAAVGSPE